MTPAARRLLAPLVGALAIGLALNLPTAWEHLRHPTSWAVPVELVLAGLVVLAAGPRIGGRLAGWLAAVVTLLVALRVVDWAQWRAFGRPLSLATDMLLLPSLLEVVRGSFHPALLLGAGAAVVVALLLVHRTALLPLRALAGAGRRSRAAIGLLGLLGAAGAIQMAAAEQGLRWRLLGTHGFQQVASQAQRFLDTREALRLWAAAAAEDGVAAVPPDRLLGGLDDVDVIVVFVESYGRTALLSDPFRDRVTARLSAEQAALAQAGVATASGWLRSPTIGGQSWLAHTTLASGVWTDNQASYLAYLRSGRLDLAHLFSRAGHRTVLAAPAWIHPFPEAAGLGFDTILAAADLGYRGPAYGWVNVPDQFTMEALARATRAPEAPAGPGDALLAQASPLALAPSGMQLADMEPAILQPSVMEAVDARPSDAQPVDAQPSVTRLVGMPLAVAPLAGTQPTDLLSVGAPPSGVPRTGMEPTAQLLTGIPSASTVPVPRQPAYAQVALIGSHAPFVPLAPYLADWDRLGDGAVFASLPATHVAAEVVWRDVDAIRAAYAASLDATLEVLGGFSRRHVDARSLLILVGDHEPAAMVTGDAQARTVPIHVLAGDPALLQPFLDWGLEPGLIPGEAASVHGMDEFRDALVAMFTPAPEITKIAGARAADGAAPQRGAPHRSASVTSVVTAATGQP